MTSLRAKLKKFAQKWQTMTKSLKRRISRLEDPSPSHSPQQAKQLCVAMHHHPGMQRCLTTPHPHDYDL
jgi:cytochrome b